MCGVIICITRELLRATLMQPKGRDWSQSVMDPFSFPGGGGDLGSERTESVTAYFLKSIKSVAFAFFFSEMHLLFSFYLITFNSIFFKKYIEIIFLSLEFLLFVSSHELLK